MNLEIISYLGKTESKKGTIVFVHGAYHGAWCWEENLMPFFQSKGYDCYALSLRGHGNSEGKEEIDSFTLQDYTEDVLRVLKTIDDIPILVGHSMGGAIIQIINEKYPEKLRGMVLLSSIPPYGMLSSLLRLMITKPKKARELLNFGVNNNYKAVGELFFSENLSREKYEKYSHQLISESKIASMNTLKRVVEKGKARKDHPILIIGSSKDNMISKKAVLKTGKFYKAKTSILQISGHDLMLDVEWKKVAKLVLDFIGEVFCI